MVRLKIAYWEFDFEAVCPTLDHDLLSQAHICVCVYGMNLKYALCWHIHISVHSVLRQCYWAIQRSWFARVNALCNLSRKKLQEVAAHFWADF